MREMTTAGMRFKLNQVATKAVNNRCVFFGVVVMTISPVFFLDLDVLAALANLDRLYDGWYVDELITDFVLLLMAGICRHAVLLRWEVRRRQVAEVKAERLARHDPLTGLPNRRVLQEALDTALGALHTGGSRAIMIVDLDGFKAVNDQLGHLFGDELLCRAVDRLRTLVGSRATLARLGGDEFVVLLPGDVARDEVALVADCIVTRLAEPFELLDRQVEIGASVGVAFARIDGDTTSKLLHAADLALNRAKSNGRGTFRFFEPEMDRLIGEQAALKLELRNAIANDEIVPFYQPTVDLRTGKVTGMEVLARWQHPSRGLVGPDAFIPIAENMRLITALTLAVFRQVCEDAAKWPGDFRFAVNLSPSQLQDANIFEQLQTMVEEAGLDPTRFEVELTETALVQNLETARQRVERLHAMGWTVALDDFGTGYSGLYLLREINFDKVKIDKSFVTNIASNPTSARFTSAVIQLIASLDLEVTAEGIEDSVARDMLSGLHCAFGQGFLFSKPVAATQVPSMLERLSAHAQIILAAA